MGSTVDNSSAPVRSEVHFEPLPNCDILATLLKPTILVLPGDRGWETNDFPFALTEDHIKSVESRTSSSNVQIQLRFCELSTSGRDLKDSFPWNLHVKVNNKDFSIPKFETDSKRKGVPLDISVLCDLHSPVVNSIKIACWRPTWGYNYVVGIYLVSRRHSELLISRLKEEAPRKSHLTLAMIEKMKNAEADVMVSSLCVSLKCPIDKCRMSIPCRTTSCDHVQCFDGVTFIQMNEMKLTICLCPVCNKHVDLESLYVDDFFTKICSEAPPNCTEIELHKDGTWTPVMMHDGTLRNDRSKNPLKRDREVEVIDITSDDDVEVILKEKISRSSLL